MIKLIFHALCSELFHQNGLFASRYLLENYTRKYIYYIFALFCRKVNRTSELWSTKYLSVGVLTYITGAGIHTKLNISLHLDIHNHQTLQYRAEHTEYRLLAHLLNGIGDRDRDLDSCPIFCSIFTLAGRVILRLLKFFEEDDMLDFLLPFLSVTAYVSENKF